MSYSTAKNEIQVLLQEYLGNRKVAKVAEAVYAVMQKETQHTHNDKKFFINELFAAYHVLLRLQEPRHPPYALTYFLTIANYRLLMIVNAISSSIMSMNYD